MRLPALTTRLALTCGLLLLAHPSGSGEALTMRVVPGLTASAPAAIMVIATVPRHEDNRALLVVAESREFYRSSQVDLNGDRAPRTSQFTFKNLPVGEYEITVILGGSRGQRAMSSRAFYVTGPFGR
jgi:hypothetical protein